MRRPVIVGLAFTVLAVLGISAIRSTNRSTDRNPARADASAVGTISAPALAWPTSSTAEAEVDVRDVAINAVALTDDVFRAGFISRRELIETFATESFGPELAAETSQQVTGLLLELGERDVAAADVSMVEQPVAARLVDADPTNATVDVWSVLVIAADGAGPARQVWRTVSVDLQLFDGVWLVDGWSSALGPTPTLAPEAVISEVDDVIDVVGWPHVSHGAV